MYGNNSNQLSHLARAVCHVFILEFKKVRYVHNESRDGAASERITVVVERGTQEMTWVVSGFGSKEAGRW